MNESATAFRRLVAGGAAAAVTVVAAGTLAAAGAATGGGLAASRGACVPAPIRHGPAPAWTAPVWANSSQGFATTYALASNGAVAAFFNIADLRAGHPSNPSNKVLWVMRYARNGMPLEIAARSGAHPSRTVHLSFSANASPGEIYPSLIDLPSAGCWRLALRWNGHTASIDVRVHPAVRSWRAAACAGGVAD